MNKTYKHYQYQYQAWNKQGKKIEGIVEANNARELRENLEKQDLFLENFSRIYFKKSIKAGEITRFFSALAWMQQSGIDLIQALILLNQNQGFKNLKPCISSIQKSIESGSSFAEALNLYPQYFDLLSIQWIKAGEKTGRLEESLLEIANWRARKSQVQKQIKKALTYPCLVLLVMGVVLWILLCFVIPSFELMFASFNSPLPSLTLGVIRLSKVIIHSGFKILLITLACFLALIFLIQKSKCLRKNLDRGLIQWPGIGVIYYHALIFKTLGLLGICLKAGLPLFEAIDSAILINKNTVMIKILEQAKSRLWEGWPLSLALEESGYFYPETLSLLKISEASGTQDKILEILSSQSEGILKNKLDQYLSLLEPALMIFIGGLVGVVVLAMYGPIFQLGNLV